MVSVDPDDGMVRLKRAELVTRDMDEIAETIRTLYVEHVATFSCPDPAHVDGVVRSVTAGGLNASMIRYGGFAYSADTEPAALPMAVVCTGNSGVIATKREDLRLARGDVFLVPADLPSVTAVNPGSYMALMAPWAAVTALAETSAGVPAAELRFGGMAAVSVARKRTLARITRFICDELVISGASEINPLILQEMIRLAAVAFLTAFPNTTMTAPYQRGPGWVGPAAVRRAVAFIEAGAGQPVTLEQIAAAAGVTGRALQYTFRRYLGTSPTGYLRRVRLERAHAELQAASPLSGVTVTAVARRWGWTSSSQFTMAYRQRFDVLPSHTLRRG
jgi:AraC-like DNA-binding protein